VDETGSGSCSVADFGVCILLRGCLNPNKNTRLIVGDSVSEAVVGKVKCCCHSGMCLRQIICLLVMAKV
jgi:hypothetical protein